MFLLDQGLTMTSMTMSRALVWQCSNSRKDSWICLPRVKLSVHFCIVTVIGMWRACACMLHAGLRLLSFEMWLRGQSPKCDPALEHAVA